MNPPAVQPASGGLTQRLRDSRQRVNAVSEQAVEGRLTRLIGLTMEASGCRAPLGSRCLIDRGPAESLEAEVAGFNGERLLLMPIDHSHGVLPGAKVRPVGGSSHIPVGEALLGRVLDGRGRPIDQKGPLRTHQTKALSAVPINPLMRTPITAPLDVGVNAINALLTVGQGQRMGLFAPAGVGKSTLLGMMTRGARADVVVVGLIGERGREVQEFIQQILGPEGLARSVVVAAPADTAPLMRVHAAHSACAVAEHFRDRGKQVLLLMDSLTRYAQAFREIALATGEPPAMRGYSPSVFARIPQLIERAGTGTGAGAITAFYTILTEGDAELDPVAESARAILDGHIVLSRRLAEQGQFPAIDVGASISRLMNTLAVPEHKRSAQRFRRLLADYEQQKDLIDVGAYVPGSNPPVDLAIQAQPRLTAYLRQGIEDSVALDTSIQNLHALINALDPDGVTA